jgi:acyl-CoA synthetase (AMP-forming)/AMP-acid ligase II
MLRTDLYADPHGRFVHDVVLESCSRFANKTAIIDTSYNHRISYAEYGEMVEALARGLVLAGLRPGEIVAINLPNCWEFCVAYHAATLAGAVPTLLNPSYREREVRYQLVNSGATILITDGPQLEGINLTGLPSLRRVYTTRQASVGAEVFASLLHPVTVDLPRAEKPSDQTLAVPPTPAAPPVFPRGSCCRTTI